MSYERVLLPVSGKQSGERALKALSQARKLDPKEIILLHAVAPSVGSPMPNIMRDQQDIAVKAEALLAPLRRTGQCRHPLSDRHPPRSARGDHRQGLQGNGRRSHRHVLGRS